MDDGEARLLSETDAEFRRVHSGDFYIVINDQLYHRKSHRLAGHYVDIWKPRMILHHRQRLNASQTAADGFSD